MIFEALVDVAGLDLGVKGSALGPWDLWNP